MTSEEGAGTLGKRGYQGNHAAINELDVFDGW